jgi:hypothetical protein
MEGTIHLSSEQDLGPVSTMAGEEENSKRVSFVSDIQLMNFIHSHIVLVSHQCWKW